jgi:hypothetical protein
LFDISGTLDLMAPVTYALCSIVCADAAPAFSISAVRRRSLDIKDLPDGPEQFIKVVLSRVDGGSLRNVPESVVLLDEPWEFSSGLSPQWEIRILCLVQRLMGGDLYRDSEEGSLCLLFPCID